MCLYLCICTCIEICMIKFSLEILPSYLLQFTLNYCCWKTAEDKGFSFSMFLCSVLIIIYQLLCLCIKAPIPASKVYPDELCVYREIYFAFIAFTSVEKHVVAGINMSVLYIGWNYLSLDVYFLPWVIYFMNIQNHKAILSWEMMKWHTLCCCICLVIWWSMLLCITCNYHHLQNFKTTWKFVIIYSCFGPVLRFLINYFVMWLWQWAANQRSTLGQYQGIISHSQILHDLWLVKW